jgi:hypothetical protein
LHNHSTGFGGAIKNKLGSQFIIGNVDRIDASASRAMITITNQKRCVAHTITP